MGLHYRRDPLFCMVSESFRRKSQSTVRIIAGRYRGRRIPVPPQGVRPSGDRVRETLFNWLQSCNAGARCLDMYAGTGVLGIEALSRGAAATIFVEKNRAVAAELSRTLLELEPHNGRVIQADAAKLNYSGLGPFDIVFIDPPFNEPEHGRLCTLLEQTACLADRALVYIEMSRAGRLPELSANWSCWRESTAGQVRFALLQWQAAAASNDNPVSRRE